jgi:hypothetical protein
MMTASFSHDDVFPIIRRIILTIHEHTHEYVTHDEILAGFLADRAGLREVQAALQALQSQHSVTLEQIAGNMIAWFSQRITVGQSHYGHDFERTKVRGKWAYRPRQTDSPASPSVQELLRRKLEQDFDRLMHYRFSVEVPADTGYRPMRMVEMIDRYGGIATVRRLMTQYADFASEGYTRLWERGRLDLSFEALMHDKRFAALFSDVERAWARERLAEYGYRVS